MFPKQNFVFIVVWVVNFLLTLKLHFEQASTVLLAVLIFTSFLLTLTLKITEKDRWHWWLVFIAISFSEVTLFWKLFLSTEPQGGILITIAIMAGLLLLTLRVNLLEFQSKFPFLIVKNPENTYFK
jgi:hypothetical protein